MNRKTLRLLIGDLSEYTVAEVLDDVTPALARLREALEHHLAVRAIHRGMKLREARELLGFRALIDRHENARARAGGAR